MTYSENELLPLSGLQHFAFCRRQWALIHIERLWAEDLRTVEGALFHQRAHDQTQRERRGGAFAPVYAQRTAFFRFSLPAFCDKMQYIHSTFYKQARCFLYLFAVAPRVGRAG